MINVEAIRKQFLVYKKYPNLRFFDSAASSLKHKNVVKAMTDYLSYNGTNVHRGVYSLAQEATDLYEKGRTDVARFIGSKPEEVIFTKSTTHALNMLARGLKDLLQKGDEIVLSGLEHHSNLLPWLELASEQGLIVKWITPEDGKITIPNFKKVLSSRTRLVITHHISNVMGYITPIEKMIELSHKVGAYVVLDAAQSIAYKKLNVANLDVDFVAFSGHKMYGPNGVGVLYGKYKLLELIKPAEFGGEMVDKVILPKSTFKAPPYKFESGTPPIAEVIGLSEAIKFIEKVGQKKLYQHALYLRNYCLDKLKNEPFIEIYNQAENSTLLTFNIEGVHPHDTASFLDQYEVAVRAGHHCNQLTMKYLNQDATNRASFSCYNSINDCNILIDAILETRNFFKNI